LETPYKYKGKYSEGAGRNPSWVLSFFEEGYPYRDLFYFVHLLLHDEDVRDDLRAGIFFKGSFRETDSGEQVKATRQPFKDAVILLVQREAGGDVHLHAARTKQGPRVRKEKVMDGVGEIFGNFLTEDSVVPKGNIGDREVKHPIRKVRRFEASVENTAVGMQSFQDRGGQTIQFDFGPIHLVAQRFRSHGFEVTDPCGWIESMEGTLSKSESQGGFPHRADDWQSGLVGVEGRTTRRAQFVFGQQIGQLMHA
jgi:hypothetical protein